MMFYTNRFFLSTLVVTTSLMFSGSSLAAFSQMVSFGDSLSDSGNAMGLGDDAFPHPIYLEGRASNGPVWNEVLATNLGLDAPTPSRYGGTNYAWGGARAAVDNNVPSVQSQVNQYLADANGVADPNAVFTLTGGGNDLNALIAGQIGLPGVTQAAADMSAIVQQLIDAGANAVVLANVPDLGKAPAGAGSFTASYITAAFMNANLVAPQAEAVLFDTFSLHNDIDANPSNYGVTNTRSHCINDVAAGVTPNCDTYLIVDSLHPTKLGHEIFADSITPAVLALDPNPIPVPAALPLFVSALVGLRLFGKRKA